MTGARQIQPEAIQHAGDSLPGSADGDHIIATKNRWSRMILGYHHLAQDTWCEISFRIRLDPAETSLGIDDYASLGVDFLMPDGSSIDFPHVPGLERADIDPYNVFIASPTSLSGDERDGTTRRVRFTFLMPAPATRLSVTIRGWRNTHPFLVTDLSFKQYSDPSQVAAAGADDHQPTLGPVVNSRRIRIALGPEPKWFRYALVPRQRLFLRGQIIAHAAKGSGTIARVIFRDGNGDVLPQPYAEMSSDAALGAFVEIPTHMQARRFTLEFIPPPEARQVEIGFQSGLDTGPVDLMVPFEVALDNDLQLDALTADDPARTDIVRELSTRLELASPAHPGFDPSESIIDSHALATRPRLQEQLEAIRQGAGARRAPNRIAIGTFPDWPVPDTISWSMDPFDSSDWRREYLSLGWLGRLATQGAAEDAERALSIAMSWRSARREGELEDGIILHPLSTAVRTEILLDLLAYECTRESATETSTRGDLLEEITRHGFQLSEMLGQGASPHAMHQLRAACALLTLATALPRFWLSPFWQSLAIARIAETFQSAVSPSGAILMQSLEDRLELVSIGLLLEEFFAGRSDGHIPRIDWADLLRDGAISIISATDPSGVLPPFGDRSGSFHHASWIRRLVTKYGQPWLKDEGFRHEFAYPEGARSMALAEAGLFTARKYRHGHEWRYFCTTTSGLWEQRQHCDATSFVYSAGGVAWIIDPGGSTRDRTDAASEYLRSARAHNLALPHGKDLVAGVARLHRRAVFDGAELVEFRTTLHGPALAHRRIFLFRQDLGALAVFDDFAGAKEDLAVDGFLHFHPDILVGLAASDLAIGFQRQRKLRVRPRAIIGTLEGLAILRGEGSPTKPSQGFAVSDTNAVVSSNTLRYRFTGNGRACAGVILAIDEAAQNAIDGVLNIPDARAILSEPL